MKHIDMIRALIREWDALACILDGDIYNTDTPKQAQEVQALGRREARVNRLITKLARDYGVE